MKAKYENHEWRVTEGAERYNENKSAMPSPRVLNGSTDDGYWAEYIGYGEIDGVPVRCIYLLDYDQSEIEDEGEYDWDIAQSNGRIEIMVDELSEDDYRKLVMTTELTIHRS